MQYWKVRRVFPGSPVINWCGWLFLTNNHDSVANVSFPGWISCKSGIFFMSMIVGEMVGIRQHILFFWTLLEWHILLHAREGEQHNSLLPSQRDHTKKLVHLKHLLWLKGSQLWLKGSHQLATRLHMFLFQEVIVQELIVVMTLVKRQWWTMRLGIRYQWVFRWLIFGQSRQQATCIRLPPSKNDQGEKTNTSGEDRRLTV